MEEAASSILTPETQLFHDVFDASLIGIAVENLEGQPLFVNPAFCSFLGFSEDELRHKHCVDFSPPEDAAKDWALFQQLRAGSIDHYQLEKRYFRKDGSLVWGRLHISLFKSHLSPLVLAMVEDVTDKKTAQEALQESEELLRLAVRAGRMFAYSWDAATDVIERSGESGAILGAQSEQAATGAAISAMVHADDKQRLETALSKLTAETPTFQITYRIIRPDGTVAWLERNSRAYFDEHGKVKRIVGMVADVTARKHAEELQRATNRTLEQQTAALRFQEELLSVFVKSVPAAVAMLDRNMRYLQTSDRWCSEYLPGRTQILGCSHYEIFPDLPERWKEVHRRALQGETLRAEEDRWDGQQGARWARWEVRPWRMPDGAVGGILIFAEDITRRKQMEEDLSKVSQRLIEAHEEERTRIARELHDDVNQRLALLAVSLEGLEQNPQATATELRKEIGKTVKQLQELGNDVQAISHQLHSSKLEYLGLASAAGAFCRELSHRPGIEIDFQSEHVPRNLPNDISLCLFRTLQEGLQNAIKHSGASQFQVSLTGQANQIELIVRDSGMGFDVEQAMKGKGLGLTSMIERLKLVNGKLFIDAPPQRGTTIHAWVPLTPRAKWAQPGAR